MASLHLIHVPGVMPGKWIERFTATHPQDTLHARPLPEGADALAELAAGRARMALLRYPAGESPASPRLHVIELYEERPVVVVPREHDAEYYGEQEEIPAEEAAAWPRLDPADFPASQGGVAAMVEVVASGAGAIAVLPQSLARLHGRKDTVWRYVEGEPATAVGLAWPRVDPSLPDEEQPLAVQAAEDPLVEEFIGVVRGRRAGSSRQPSVREREQAEARVRAEERSRSAGAAGKSGGKTGGKSGAGKSGSGKPGRGSAPKRSGGSGGSGKGGARRRGRGHR